MRRLGRHACWAALVGCTPSAFALPMASEGSWMTMADVSGGGERDLGVNFALTGRDALGVMTARWREPVRHAAHGEQHLDREAVGLTYTRLLHRWNLPHAQANLWFVGSAGSVRGQGWQGAQTFWSPAVMADYETTRLYLGAGFEPKRSDGLVRHDSTWLRAGFSFYEVDYEQVQPWLIVEGKRVRYGSSTRNELTPMLRFIHRGLFVEVGGNRNGAQLNLMWSY